MTPDEATNLVGWLSAHFPYHPLPAETIAVYAQSLLGYDSAVARRAVDELIKTHPYPKCPQLADITRSIAEQASGLPTPGDAWALVLERMRSTYPGQPAPRWDAPWVVQRAVEQMGGLWTVRMSTNPGAEEHRFLELYGALREREIRDLQVAGPELMAALRDASSRSTIPADRLEGNPERMLLGGDGDRVVDAYLEMEDGEWTVSPRNK